jgi:hypothetical protein
VSALEKEKGEKKECAVANKARRARWERIARRSEIETGEHALSLDCT